MAQKNINKIFSQIGILETITAAKTLDIYDTGKIFSITQDGTGFAFTLPTATTAAEAAALPGWNAAFILTTASTAAVTIVRQDTSNDSLTGMVTTHTQDNLSGVTLSSHTVTFSNDSVVGDRVEIACITATTSATTFIATCYCDT
jgi:hypothetical protein